MSHKFLPYASGTLQSLEDRTSLNRRSLPYVRRPRRGCQECNTGLRRIVRGMRRILAAIVAMTVPAVAALADPAQTPGSNITVTTCHAQIGKPPLRIAYENASTKTAHEVDFSIVDAAGLIETLRDVGTFESGKPINHVFDLSPDVSPLGSALRNAPLRRSCTPTARPG